MPSKIPQEVREEQLNALPGKRFVRWVGEYVNQRSKVVMQCDKGHEWLGTVTGLIDARRGCPKCAGKYVYSTTEREAQLNALPGKRFVSWDGPYRNNRSNAVMQCDNGHNWSASVSNLLDHGKGCPKCARVYRYTSEEREAQLNAIANMKFVRWADGYTNVRSKAVMLCDKGHEWSASSGHLLNGRGCPKCAKVYRYSTEEIEAELRLLPNMHFSNLLGKYENGNSKAVMRCDHGHKWEARIRHLLRSGSRCPVCAGNLHVPAQTREAQLQALPGVDFIRWHSGFLNINSKAVMACSEGHEWAASICSLLRGHGCPSCAKSGYDPSKPGTLYALRHENGSHIKIGVSNVYAQRLLQLRRATPFEFEPVALHSSDDGRAIAELEKAFHLNFESSGFTGFDGATEWLKFNQEILSIMRILGA